MVVDPRQQAFDSLRLDGQRAACRSQQLGLVGGWGTGSYVHALRTIFETEVCGMNASRAWQL